MLFLLHQVRVTLTSIDFVADPGCYNVFVRMYFDDFLTDSKVCREDINDKLPSGKLKVMSIAGNEISMNLVYN